MREHLAAVKKACGVWAVISSHLCVATSVALGASMGVSMDVAVASPAPLLVRPGKVPSPMIAGVAIGGQARDEFSLLSVQREPMAGANGERIVLSYGDRFGRPQKGETGFFHIALDRDNKRVVIDLSQMRKTAVDPEKLAKILGASKLIASSEMTMDPYDGSTNITLTLKVPVRIQVGSVTDEQSKIVIELHPSVVAGAKP